MTNYKSGEQLSGCLLKRRRKGSEMVMTIKSNMKDPCGDGNVLYLDYINVKSSLCYCSIVSQDITTWEKLVKDT